MSRKLETAQNTKSFSKQKKLLKIRNIAKKWCNLWQDLTLRLRVKENYGKKFKLELASCHQGRVVQSLITLTQD